MCFDTTPSRIQGSTGRRQVLTSPSLFLCFVYLLMFLFLRRGSHVFRLDLGVLSLPPLPLQSVLGLPTRWTKPSLRNARDRSQGFAQVLCQVSHTPAGSWETLSRKKVKAKFPSPAEGSHFSKLRDAVSGKLQSFERKQRGPGGAYQRHRWSGSGLGARGRCDLPLISAAFLSLHCPPHHPDPPPSLAPFCHLRGLQPQSPEGAWAKVLTGLLVPGQVGRWGLWEGRKEGGGEARRGGGCQSL